MNAKPYWAPDNSERILLNILAERDLRADKIPTAGSKRPDFQVYRGDVMEFYCEVKELTDADPLENHYLDITPGVQVAEQIKKGHARLNRISRCIHESVKQFDSINPEMIHPNVLAFVNWDDLCSSDDLKDLLSVGLEMTNGKRMTFAPPPAHQLIEADRGRIHAFVWINLVPQEQPIRIFYWSRPCSFTARLKVLFSQSNHAEGGG